MKCHYGLCNTHLKTRTIQTVTEDPFALTGHPWAEQWQHFLLLCMLRKEQTRVWSVLYVASSVMLWATIKQIALTRTVTTIHVLTGGNLLWVSTLATCCRF